VEADPVTASLGELDAAQVTTMERGHSALRRVEVDLAHQAVIPLAVGCAVLDDGGGAGFDSVLNRLLIERRLR
jgi:hypothetical protein